MLWASTWQRCGRHWTVGSSRSRNVKVGPLRVPLSLIVAHIQVPSTRCRWMNSDHCELCEAAPITPRLFEDSSCWIAECESCSVPMVVWKVHAPEPPEEVKLRLLRCLAEAVADGYDFEHYVDDNMRSIPTHYHAHARRKRGLYSSCE